MNAIVWIIAGADSSNGAGIKADSDTCQQLGVHACAVITAMTAQATHDVRGIHFLPAEFITQQMAALADQFKPQAIKIGMLGRGDIIDAVASFLRHYAGKTVLDPVLFASSGKPLFEGELKAYTQHLVKLFPCIDLFTPNLPEAELLLERPIRSYDDRISAAREFLALGVKSVLIKAVIMMMR